MVAAEKKSIYLTQRNSTGLLPAFEFTHLLPEKERFEILDISIFASNTVHACCSNAVPCVSVFVCIRKNQDPCSKNLFEFDIFGVSEGLLVLLIYLSLRKIQLPGLAVALFQAGGSGTYKVGHLHISPQTPKIGERHEKDCL